MPITPPATPNTDTAPAESGRPTPEPPRPRPRKHKRAPRLVLENAGSVARDHLASERTFLAYIRTSLLLASTGVALVQLFAIASTDTPFAHFARPLGAVLVAFSLVVLVIGVYRYFLVQTLLTQGQFPPARFSLAAVAAVTAILILIVFAILVSARK